MLWVLTFIDVIINLKKMFKDETEGKPIILRECSNRPPCVIQSDVSQIGIR